MSSYSPRLTAVGLLVLTLVAGAAQAAPPPRNQVRPLPRAAESADFVTVVRDWLFSLLAVHPGHSGKPSVQPKEGPILDPNGGGQH